MAEVEHIQASATVHGRVQGVGFRYSARSRAARLGLTGWVRNEPDGTVSVVCEGPRDKVGEFISWLRQGPPMAHVTNVDVRKKDASGTFRNFKVAF